MIPALTRGAASAAVADIGWRYVVGGLYTSVAVDSPDRAVGVAAAAVAACGDDAGEHLRVDLRSGRVALVLQPPSGFATERDVELAHGITDAVRDLGLDTAPTGHHRTVQSIEVAIDALDIDAIRPFWKAILGYTDEIREDGPTNALIDPSWQGPAMWFQQMDEPRPQRNRIHFDIIVPHDEADARIAAALDAGGHVVSDAEARAFWILADAEGNEACVCTWQDRD